MNQILAAGAQETGEVGPNPHVKVTFDLILNPKLPEGMYGKCVYQ